MGVAQLQPMAKRCSQSGLMARIVENTIRDTNDWFSSRRRDLAQDQELSADAVVHLDGRRNAPKTPLEQVSNAEQQAIVRLALELLNPNDQEILMLRNRDQLSFAEIAERLKINQTAADTRFRRAARRLEAATAKIHAREIGSLIKELEEEEGAGME